MAGGFVNIRELPADRNRVVSASCCHLSATLGAQVSQT
jgi:hypothetical protein